jgi:hypothetical protein
MASLSDSCREDRDFKAVRNLYSVDGTDQDWHYWKHGTIAYIWEGSRHNPSYKKDRDKLVKGIRSGWHYMLDRLDEGPTLSGHVYDAENGKPLEAVFSFQEIKTFQGEIHTTHPDSGRFDKALPQKGLYHLEISKDGYASKTIPVEVGKEWRTIRVELSKESGH